MVHVDTGEEPVTYGLSARSATHLAKLLTIGIDGELLGE